MLESKTEFLDKLYKDYTFSFMVEKRSDNKTRIIGTLYHNEKKGYTYIYRIVKGYFSTIEKDYYINIITNLFQKKIEANF